MDAARYFEEMHLSMSSQKPEYRLVLSVKVQDLGGADAYLELRQEPASGKARVFYSTMGRQKLNFQLVRKGWPRRIFLLLSGTTPSTAAGWRAFWMFWPILPVVVGRSPPLLPGRVRSSRWSGSWAVPPIGAIGAPAPPNN